MIAVHHFFNILRDFIQKFGLNIVLQNQIDYVDAFNSSCLLNLRELFSSQLHSVSVNTECSKTDVKICGG